MRFHWDRLVQLVMLGIVGLMIMQVVRPSVDSGGDAMSERITLRLEIPDSVIQPEWQDVGWERVDVLMRDRLSIIAMYDLADAPGVSEWTNAYMIELNERRKRAIAFAQKSNVRITFVGVPHDPMFTAISAESYQGIDRAQKEALAEISTNPAEDTLVAIEPCYGYDEALTFETYSQRSQQISRDLHAAGFDMGFKATSPDGHATRKELGGTEKVARGEPVWSYLLAPGVPAPVYCSEEWPLVVDVELNYRKLKMTQQYATGSTPITDGAMLRMEMPYEEMVKFRYIDQPISEFRHLRSEIVLIRAIELLERTGLHNGVIVGGLQHGHDLERVRGEYPGVDLSVWYPSGYGDTDAG